MDVYIYTYNYIIIQKPNKSELPENILESHLYHTTQYTEIIKYLP